MNNIIAIILLIILIIILVLMLKILIPSFKGLLNKMPKGIFILLILVIVLVIIYLVRFLIGADDIGINSKTGGNIELEEASIEDSVETEIIENCIILRGDEILIDNQVVDLNAVNEYIDYRVENRIELIIVDDYSFATLHDSIINICKNKGVKFKEEDEKWFTQ